MALIAFAGNSILCRLALQQQLIDPTSFTLIRLLSGALTLAIIVIIRSKPKAAIAPINWLSAASLFTYAWAFSLSYQMLDTGTGALILFGCVQFSMIGISLLRGVRLTALEWFGGVVALLGFIILMLPSAQAPNSLGALLMALAGFAWGIYSVRGAGSSNALFDTAGNFVHSLWFMSIAVLVAFFSNHFALFEKPLLSIVISTDGVILAALSGAITSGIGYAIWYMVLAHLRSTVAAVSQLSVPIIAALGGVIFINESVSTQLLVSTIVTLTGIALVIIGKQKGH